MILVSSFPKSVQNGYLSLIQGLELIEEINSWPSLPDSEDINEHAKYTRCSNALRDCYEKCTSDFLRKTNYLFIGHENRQRIDQR